VGGEERVYGAGRGAVFPPAAGRRLRNPFRVLLHPPTLLARRLAPRPHERIVELGCGSGWFTGALARRTAGATLLLADLQPDMLRQARRPPGRSAVPAVVADATALPCRPGTVDAVVLAAVLGEVPEPRRALHEVSRALRPTGRVLVLETRTDPDFVPLGHLLAMAAEADLHLGRRYGRLGGYTAVLTRRPIST
jgi:ubiquinone/menaquinone biosynthesis C-methylase UbiE